MASVDGREAGEAPLHLGWSPDGKVCLGAGPCLVRLSEDEASELINEVHGMLLRGPTPNGRCGCGGSGADDVAEAVQAATSAAKGRFGW